MNRKLNISFDSDLIESISSDFDLRAPNKEALRKIIFALDGDYNPSVMQVLNLATGVGKTYLMAALIEYLRRQGVGNVVIVTPGKTVQAKTVQNFTPGSSKYINGAQVPPDIVTPHDYSAWIARVNGEPRLSYGNEIPVLAFIFNIQQLIAPKEMDGETHGSSQDAERRKPRRFDENAGVLFDYLKGLNDLVVIADESHLYSTSAAAFHSALEELDPAATIGLTASVQTEDYVIYKYPLYRAIQDHFVKSPVLAFRKEGYGSDIASEEQQLRDALKLREIKQAYYDMYSDKLHVPHINAVAFVVCSDVDHATQVTNLLRSPEYIGNELAVLQVDSKHEDDTTQFLLESIDEPNSPVLVVVSVNKLKEGWDVKNIAVVVTLRAMASEVLTQQTMGRGLRLPFGKYTGVWQIDQLDIISHQSFKELLQAENILEQFGLEDAVSQNNASVINTAIRGAVENNVGNNTPFITGSHDERAGFVVVPQNQTDSNNSYTNGNEDTDSNLNTVGIRFYDDDNSSEDTVEERIEPMKIRRNERFLDVEYKFPVTYIELIQPPIDLSEIDDRVIEDAAKRITSTGDILYRKEIVAALGKKIQVVDAESAEVDSISVSNSEAELALIKLVSNIQLVPKTSDSLRFIREYIVPRFMNSANKATWTVKSLESAKLQLQKVITDYIVEIQRKTKEKATIKPQIINLDEYDLPYGEKIYDPIESREQFVRGRVYSGWFKSLFENESFDSFSGEYELAKLLNTSPHVVWWHRLHSHNRAFIYYTPIDRYFPDFVVMDDKGVCWIVEGKDQRGRDDSRVQAKRKAAESLVRKMVLEKEYEGQHWGYLIAYEDDIKRSDSWDDLKTYAQPISNEL